MRVAYLSADPGVPVFGTKGASVHVQEVLRAFRARGDSVRLYAARTGEHVPPDLVDLPLVHVPVDGDHGGAAGSREERTARREQRQAAASLAMATLVVDSDAELAYERYSLFSTALAEVTVALGIPGVLEVNAPLIDEQAVHRHLVDGDAALRTLRTQVGAASVVACVSEPVAQWVRTHCPDAGAKVRVVPNGVNTRRIRPTVAPDDGDPVVLFVGTLKPWHGVEVLLDAAVLARETWRVRIVGDGPEGPALAAQAERLGLEVDFRGAVVPDDIPAALDGATVAVAPYPVLDGSGQYFSPLKIYEYAAAALPVVASAVGQVPSIVQDGITGLLVRPSDPGSLAAAVDILVKDPARARAVGRAGRVMVETEHSWDAVLARVLTGIPRAGEAGHGRTRGAAA
ncbi:glycosyltransferase family 4 protein [Knoellia sp. CPCC 206435]|uniref:glycosyltransferase family 4 protein n=1 Tax=Knoellia terrae TaxID=3404797 RepID=UPI003B43A6B4